MVVPDPQGPQGHGADQPGPAALRVLRVLVAAGRALTVSAVHAELGGHPNTLRQHLQRLVDDGWVREVPQPPHGRGRPSMAYLASGRGKRVATARSATLVDAAFVEALAEHLAAEPQPGVVAVSLGRKWGERLGVPQGYDGLLSTLAGQGFIAERTSDGVEIRTCPLLDVARRHPDVVCGIHQGLIDSLSAEPLTLAPFARPGVCLAVAAHG